MAEARAPVAVKAEDRPAAERMPAAGAPKPDESRAKSKQERDEMRRRITEAMQARERAAAAREDDAGKGEGGEAGPGERSPAEAEPKAKPRPDDEAPAPGNLIDRTGNHGHLAKVMNEDLMPLVDECYALARETQPELTGMLVLDVEMIGDEDIGGVIETVAPGQANELIDPGLMECVRESLLSTTLPPPPEGGKDAISLSLRLEPEEG